MKGSEHEADLIRRCPKCGGEPQAAEAAAATQPEAGEVPAGTRCEWCGAEYTLTSP